MCGIPLVDITDNLKSLLNSIFFHCACLQRSDILLTTVSEDVKCVLTSQADQLATLTPIDISGLDFDASHKLTRLPVEETYATLALDTEQGATAKTFGGETHVDRTIAGFRLEVAIDLN